MKKNNNKQHSEPPSSHGLFHQKEKWQYIQMRRSSLPWRSSRCWLLLLLLSVQSNGCEIFSRASYSEVLRLFRHQYERMSLSLSLSSSLGSFHLWSAQLMLEISMAFFTSFLFLLLLLLHFFICDLFIIYGRRQSRVVPCHSPPFRRRHSLSFSNIVSLLPSIHIFFQIFCPLSSSKTQICRQFGYCLVVRRGASACVVYAVALGRAFGFQNIWREQQKQKQLG